MDTEWQEKTRNDKEFEGFKWNNKERQEMTWNDWKMTRNDRK